MKERIIRYLIKNKTYIILISIASVLSIFKYGLQATFLATVMLFSVYLFLENTIMSYLIITNSNEGNLRKKIQLKVLVSVLSLITMILLPARLAKLSLIFCTLLILGFLIYQFVRKKLFH